MDSELGFYQKYVSLLEENFGSGIDEVTPYKIEYLRKRIKENRVYKFISLSGNEKDVNLKINAIKQGKVWFSFYKFLNDNTEFQIVYDKRYVAQCTGQSEGYIDLIVNFLTQIYDVYSLTYDYQNYMWDEYASKGNGICVEYNIENLDYLFPVEYVEKANIDFNKMVIDGVNRKSPMLSIIPWVIKNPYNQIEGIDSTKEKEVRILYSPYDNGELNFGKLECNLKERMCYKGILKPMSEFGLTISKVTIGDKCNEQIKKELIEYFNGKNIKYELR